MKIEQTAIFHRECERFFRFAQEYKYDSRREDMAKDLIIKAKNVHGKEFAVKVANRANQKAKHRFYDITIL